ncbi:hypothetical protein [Paenibacillus sp. HJGM_3]|uniref:hypothetical protein n=1 Tax=Paenibacillus sp. HJGM_3 TaxID=3379816 RepID=UPI00385EC49C
MFENFRRHAKKLTAGELPQEDTPAEYRKTIVGLKRTICREFDWSLHQVDETDFSNLIAFIQYKPSDDPNIRVINGKTYHRATKAPSWL